MNEKQKNRRKYNQGQRLESLDELFKQEFIILNNKVYHCGWFHSRQFRLAHMYLQRGCYKVVPNSVEGEAIT